MHQILHSEKLKMVVGGANGSAANMGNSTSANPCPIGLVPTGATVNVSQVTVSGAIGINGSIATKDLGINASLTLNNTPNTSTITCGPAAAPGAASAPPVPDAGGDDPKRSSGKSVKIK